MPAMQIDRAVVAQALETIEDLTRDRLFTAEWAGKHGATVTALRAALAQQAEPVQDQRCRAEPRSDGDFVCDCKIGECPGRSAEPAQEPVAWRWGYRSVTTGEMDWRGYVEIAAHPNLRSPEIIIEPLYTAPPQRKQAEPAQEPITRLFGTLPVHDTQQALAQQAEPVQEQAEPVPGAWVASPDGRVIYDDASTDDGLLRVSGDFKNDEQRVRYAQRIVDKLNAALAQQAEPVEPVAWLIDYEDGEREVRFVAGTRGIQRTPLYTAPPQRKPLPKHDQHCVDVPGYGLMAVRLVRAVERAHGIKG